MTDTGHGLWLSPGMPISCRPVPWLWAHTPVRSASASCFMCRTQGAWGGQGDFIWLILWLLESLFVSMCLSPTKLRHPKNAFFCWRLMTHHDIFARGMSENEAFPHFMVIGFGKFRNRMRSTFGEPHWTMESDVCSMAGPRPGSRWTVSISELYRPWCDEQPAWGGTSNSCMAAGMATSRTAWRCGSRGICWFWKNWLMG